MLCVLCKASFNPRAKKVMLVEHTDSKHSKVGNVLCF